MSKSAESNIKNIKIFLYVDGDKEKKDEVYKYLHDCIKAQSQAMNMCMGAYYLAGMNHASKEELNHINTMYSRTKGSKKGSAYDNTDIVFPVGLPIASQVAYAVKNKFWQECKKGLLYGKTSPPRFKSDGELMIPRDFVALYTTTPRGNGLYHKYESDEEFMEHLYKPDLRVYIKFAHHITFQLNLGRGNKNSHELRSTIGKIFTSEYKVCDSKMGIDSKGRIYINLCTEIPKQQFELDPNIVVGVDLGLEIPAMCALNTNDYVKKAIGSKDEFLRKRTQIQNKLRRLQESLPSANGGHGTKKKLRPLHRFEDEEAGFVKNYNEYVSKQVVEFAKENKAKYINLEDLSNYAKHHKNSLILRNWSYYKLQLRIKQKAALCGIEVRFVNPAYTSQRCSKCGNLEDGQRIDQAHFECKCCGYKANADFNAARNIALANEFVEK